MEERAARQVRVPALLQHRHQSANGTGMTSAPSARTGSSLAAGAVRDHHGGWDPVALRQPGDGASHVAGAGGAQATRLLRAQRRHRVERHAA